jgi:hypothetical protein
MGEGLDIYATVYDSGYQPSLENPVDVLAFLLTPTRVFGPFEDTAQEFAAHELLEGAKFEALMTWYQSHLVKQGSARLIM